MRVIFIQDVANVAYRDEVREVKEGYALNYLLPQGLAVRATPERLAVLKARVTARAAAEGRARSQAEGQLGQLKGKRVTVTARANEQGTLYAGVGPEVIAAAVKQQLGTQLEPHNFSLDQHLKSVGEHTVEISLGEGLGAKITVVITKA